MSIRSSDEFANIKNNSKNGILNKEVELTVSEEILKAKSTPSNVVKILKKHNFTEFQIGYYIGVLVGNIQAESANAIRFQQKVKRIMDEEPRYIG